MSGAPWSQREEEERRIPEPRDGAQEGGMASPDIIPL